MAKPIEILLVEDSPSDVRLTIEALKEAKLHNQLHVATDGESAMAFLTDPAKPRPDLILLDLNLPGMDGREVSTSPTRFQMSQIVVSVGPPDAMISRPGQNVRRRLGRGTGIQSPARIIQRNGIAPAASGRRSR